VRSLETAAYVQPSAVYEVEEEEEDADYPPKARKEDPNRIRKRLSKRSTANQ